MNIPTGYTALDLVGYTDKGDYAGASTYVQNDLVHYQGDVWRCLIDDTTGITPSESANWTIFVAKPTGAAEAMIAPIESATAIAAHAVGSQLVYNDTLYDVIAAIAIGDTLMVGTNIQAADTVSERIGDVEDEVDQVKSDLSDLDDEKLDITDEQILGAWNLAKITVSTQTINGATFTVNADKSITVTKSSAGANDATLYISDIFDVEAGRTYYMSGCPAGGAASGSYRLIYQEYDGTTWKSNNNDIGNGLTITPSYSKARLCIDIAKTYIISGSLTFKIMLALKPNTPYVAPAMTNRELTDRTSFASLLETLFTTGALTEASQVTNANSIRCGFTRTSDYRTTNLPTTSASDSNAVWYNVFTIRCSNDSTNSIFHTGFQIAIKTTGAGVDIYVRAMNGSSSYGSWHKLTMS